MLNLRSLACNDLHTYPSSASSNPLTTLTFAHQTGGIADEMGGFLALDCHDGCDRTVGADEEAENQRQDSNLDSTPNNSTKRSSSDHPMSEEVRLTVSNSHTCSPPQQRSYEV